MRFLAFLALPALAALAAVVLSPVSGAWANPAAAATCGPDVLGTARTLNVGTEASLPIGLKSYPRTLPLADHEVVLTFDDGPVPGTTPAVLDALKAQCVKATFFLIGRNAEAQPALVRRALAEGHTLGHHTFSHPAATLRRLDPEAARRDIDAGFKADDLAAYGDAGAEPRVPFFRFPGFADTAALDEMLAKRRIVVFGTDLWAFDWLDIAPETELRVLMNALEKRKRGIILLHDSRASTARMLPTLLKTLKDRGYKIVHLVPGGGPLMTEAAPKDWSSETERVIAEVFAREARHHAARPPMRMRVAHHLHASRHRRHRGGPTVQSQDGSGQLRSTML